MFQGNDYVAIFKPVLKGTRSLAVDGVDRFCAEMVALWFQHVMLLQPCVMCIYERCALFGIMGAGLVGPSRQNAAALCGLASGCTAPGGLQLAWEHTMMQLHRHRLDL
jgi:disulfide bond formation protein DsbB